MCETEQKYKDVHGQSSLASSLGPNLPSNRQQGQEIKHGQVLI
jgi:hypothetical protein